ncbi:MAG: hypothetical protein ACE366_13095 [Bradymonadia bacterium]
MSHRNVSWPLLALGLSGCLSPQVQVSSGGALPPDAAVPDAEVQAPAPPAIAEPDMALPPDAQVPQFGGGFDEESDTAAHAYPEPSARCVPYLRSDVLRPRAGRVQVGPNDPWREAITTAESDTEVVLNPGRYDVEETPLSVPAGVTVRGLTGTSTDISIIGSVRMEGAESVLADVSVRRGQVGITLSPQAHNTLLWRVQTVDHARSHIFSDGSVAGVEVMCGEITTSYRGVEPSEAAIDLRGGTEWLLSDNFIYALDGVGMRFGGAGARQNVVARNAMIEVTHPVVVWPDHVSLMLQNNFILRRASGGPGLLATSSRSVRMLHNTVRVAEAPAVHFDGITEGVLLNNFFNSEPSTENSPSYTYSGNLFDAEDADFESPNSYHLVEGDRAIGVGISLTEIDQDIEGDTRWERFDVGCDQR